jgi:hypothetical protein
MTALRGGTSVLRGGRWISALFIAAYLGTTLWYLGLYAWGDTGGHPLSYFFVWDMFPSHSSWSFRRVAVGQTASGRHLQIVPSGQQQFREGVRSDRTRVDLERGGAFFRSVAERTLEIASPELQSDPIVELQLYELSWPAKFNYAPDLYERWAGSPKPDRRYWRLLERLNLQSTDRGEPPGSGS